MLHGGLQMGRQIGWEDVGFWEFLVAHTTHELLWFADLSDGEVPEMIFFDSDRLTHKSIYRSRMSSFQFFHGLQWSTSYIELPNKPAINWLLCLALNTPMCVRSIHSGIVLFKVCILVSVLVNLCLFHNLLLVTIEKVIKCHKQGPAHRFGH